MQNDVSAAGIINPEKQKKLDSAFLRAVKKGDVREAEKQLKKGADILAKYRGSTYAMELAVDAESPDMVRFLLDNNWLELSGEVRRIPRGMEWVTRNYYHKNEDFPVDILREFLDHGVDPNVPMSNGGLPLQNVKGNIEAIKMLLDYGADVNKLNENGHKTKHWIFDYFDSFSELNNHKELLDLLLSRGLNRKIIDTEENSLIAFAAEKGRFDVVFYMAEKGFDINSTYTYGHAYANKNYFPLLSATRFSATEIMKKLIDMGADVNQRDKSGNTPLMAADSISAAKILISAGADIFAKNHHGMNAAICFAKRNSISLDKKEPIIDMFFENGIDPSDDDAYGKTAAIHVLNKSFCFEKSINEFARFFAMDVKNKFHAEKVAGIIEGLSGWSTMEKGYLALVTLAVIYPAENKRLIDIFWKSPANSIKYFLGIGRIPSPITPDMLLAVVSGGKSGSLSLNGQQTKYLISLLLETMDTNPGLAAEFIRKRVGKKVETWVKDGVEGADALVSRLAHHMRQEEFMSEGAGMPDLDLF